MKKAITAAITSITILSFSGVAKASFCTDFAYGRYYICVALSTTTEEECARQRDAEVAKCKE